MDSTNLSEICRLCLDKDRVTIPIFEGEGVVRKIFHKIGSCLPVKVSENDPLPKKICDDCTYKVELVYSFWNTTANSEKQLLEWLGLSESTSDSFLEINKTDMGLLKQETLDLDNSDLSKDDAALAENSGVMLDQTDDIEGETEEDSEGDVEEDPGGGDYIEEDALSMDPIAVDNGSACGSTSMAEAGPSGIQQHQLYQQQQQQQQQQIQQQQLQHQQQQQLQQQHLQQQAQQRLQSTSPGSLNTNPSGNGPAANAGRNGSHLEETYQCTECSRVFSTVTKLSQHSKTHKERNYECGLCKKKFLTEHHLKMHGAMHEEIRPHTCDKCGCSFRYLKTLETHRKIHANEEEDRPFLCLVCDMRFSTRNAYNHHTKSHKESGKVNCSSLSCRFCGKFFASRPLLTQHIRLHIGEKGFTCDECGKELTSQESLLCHKLMHSGDKQLNCEICGRTFSHRKYYVVHQRIHTGERPYKCDVCNKHFTQASTLTVHRRYHTGERPYRCTVCSKGFVTRTLMMSHMKRHQDLTK